MNKISRKVVCILIIFLLIIGIILVNNTYAATEEEKEELIALLDEYKDDMGDLNEFKEVMDNMYNDLDSATAVNDELKQKLNEDIDSMANITGINPLILQTLQIELKSQVANLNDSNIDEVKEEIELIRDWADINISDDGTGADWIDDGSDGDFIIENPTGGDTKNYAGMILPKAGSISTILILSALVILIISALVSIIKYRQFKGIK